MSFSDEEVERYARHLVLREIGGPGQQALKAARVLIVGAGGLGAPAALYLAAAGVGELAIVDADTVALSNLQRQVLFGTDDLGRDKVDAAARRLGMLNANVRVTPIPRMLTAVHARDLICRLLDAWLKREKAPPFELLHRQDLIEKIDAAGMDLQHAIQKLAISNQVPTNANLPISALLSHAPASLSPS